LFLFLKIEMLFFLLHLRKDVWIIRIRNNVQWQNTKRQERDGRVEKRNSNPHVSQSFWKNSKIMIENHQKKKSNPFFSFFINYPSFCCSIKLAEDSNPVIPNIPAAKPKKIAFGIPFGCGA
jgi:hypothetical protein